MNNNSNNNLRNSYELRSVINHFTSINENGDTEISESIREVMSFEDFMTAYIGESYTQNGEIIYNMTEDTGADAKTAAEMLARTAQLWKKSFSVKRMGVYLTITPHLTEKDIASQLYYNYSFSDDYSNSKAHFSNVIKSLIGESQEVIETSLPGRTPPMIHEANEGENIEYFARRLAVLTQENPNKDINGNSYTYGVFNGVVLLGGSYDSIISQYNAECIEKGNVNLEGVDRFIQRASKKVDYSNRVRPFMPAKSNNI